MSGIVDIESERVAAYTRRILHVLDNLDIDAVADVMATALAHAAVRHCQDVADAKAWLTGLADNATFEAALMAAVVASDV